MYLENSPNSPYVKVINFMHIAKLHDGARYFTRNIPDYNYVAPEIAKGEKDISKADI